MWSRRWWRRNVHPPEHLAGLQVLARVGQRTGVVLDAVPDPARHPKVVHVLRPEGGGS